MHTIGGKPALHPRGMARPEPGYGAANRAATAAGEATVAAVVRSPAAQALTSWPAAASGLACGAAGAQAVVAGAVGAGAVVGGVVGGGRVVAAPSGTLDAGVESVGEGGAAEPEPWEAPQAVRARASRVTQARGARRRRVVPPIVAVQTFCEVYDP